MLYCYGRVSTDDQENSLANQRQLLEAFAAKSQLPLGGVFLDEDQSASKILLKDRVRGKIMWDAIGRGDTVALASVDRCFRSMVDAVTTIDVWKRLGVRVILVDLNIDIGTPPGEMMFGMLAVVAQMEARLISKRVKDTLSFLKRSNRPYVNTRPWGWIRAGADWSPHLGERSVGGKLLEARAGGVSWQVIASRFAIAGHKKPFRRKGSSGYYHVTDLKSLARAAEAQYPRIRQSVWQGRRQSDSLLAAESGDPARVCEA